MRATMHLAIIGSTAALALLGCGGSSQEYKAVQGLCDELFVAGESAPFSPEFITNWLTRAQPLVSEAAEGDSKYRTLAAAIDGTIVAIEAGDAERYAEDAMLTANECVAFASGQK